MKKMIRRVFAMTTLLAVLLSTVAFAEEDKYGTGDYTVSVYNDPSTTAMSIVDDLFHAYQIFSAADVTSYSVTEAFRGFFTGTSLVSGDGSGTTYNFQQYLTIIDAFEGLYGVDGESTDATEQATYETALVNYNQLAGQYMDSYASNMYALALQIRAYIDTVGAYAVTGGFECMAHATAVATSDYEHADLVGLDTGYYFVFDQESVKDGLGVAATGAFVPLVTGDAYYTTVEVKENVPTMTKNIYHDDQNKWDIVGDSQIGDAVLFRVISTLPNNIEDYISSDNNLGAIDSYTYTLGDVMTEGLTYNQDVTIYLDSDGLVPLNDYYTHTADATGFEVEVDVINLKDAYPELTTLYTFYSATLNEDAAVMNDYDENTATLTYSSNPYDKEDFGYIESTVFSYAFALDVFKTDESGNALAGARFGLFDEDGNAIPLSFVETAEDGTDLYCYDTSVAVIADGGYITTSETGMFEIYGLNDQVTYTLREVEAPSGYNTADQFDFLFTVYYDDLGTTITHLTDGSAYVNTATDNAGDWSANSTIINRLKIYLPSTGGVGTVMFQVGGGALMLGAVAMLMMNNRKKATK